MVDKNNNWYVIYTTPRAEKRVAERLLDLGFKNYLPLISVKKIWSDRVKIVEQPLFNSYIFVQTNVEELRNLVRVEGVVRALYFSGEPAVVYEREIKQIAKFVKNAGICTIEQGDMVEILCGDLKSVSGEVVRIGKTHLYLYLEQLSATVCVKKENVLKQKKYSSAVRI